MLTGAIFVGMLLALLVGGLARQHPGLADALPLITWMGSLFKQLLLVLIYPLVLASMVVGVVNLGDIRRVGRLAGAGLTWFFSTTALAVVLGIVMVNVFEPGVGVDLALPEAPPDGLGERGFGDFFLEMLKNTFKNPFSSLAGGDVLAIIAFGLLVGAVTSTLGEEGKPVADFFRSLNAVMMRLTDWVMVLAPVGVFALLSEVVAAQGLDAVSALASYCGVVVAALLIHGVLVLPALCWLLGGMPPWTFFAGIRKALMVAFSTASSAATLPITMECCEEQLGVEPRVVHAAAPSSSAGPWAPR